MPLRTVESVEPSSLQTAPEKYLIFYSSITNGRLWCPDCVSVDAAVHDVFGPDGAAGLIVYVGQKPEWKTPSNPFRSEPWNVSSVPTIIKLKDSKETGRLVDNEISLDKLKSFVQD